MKIIYLLLTLCLISCSSSDERYKVQEYLVAGDENLDEIVRSKFPSFMLKDPILKDNLYIMLQTYNQHLPHYPKLKDGDKLYLSRPTSPYIPSPQ